MLFKDIKQNYPVYILNKQELEIVYGKATSVSFPRMDMNQKTGKSEMVVDVTVEAKGKTATYAIPEGLSVTYSENVVLATDKMSLVSEIEAMKNTAEQILASVERQQAIVDKSASLLAELNPVYREKMETEERFGKIEGSVAEMKEMLASFIKEFKG